MPPRILHVDLDAFFVEVCRRHNPELRDVELLVVGGRRESRGVVQSASYGARKFGVRSGMPIAQAARLCPGATFFKGEFAHYRAASRAVRAILARHSPEAVMASLDEAYLDFSGTERLYPVSLLPVAERLRREVSAETGLDSSIGIGPNRMIAKLASDYAKPRGICEVRSGWEEGFVAGLELRALPGVGPKTAAKLAQVGLTEVVQVQRLSEPELARLVGDYSRELKWRAHGNGSAALHAERLARSVSRETTLGQDTSDPEYLDGLLVRFVGHVAGQLREEGLVARTVVLKLRHGDFHTVTRRHTLREATDLDAELLAPARALFRPAFDEVKRRRQGVRLIGVAATNLAQAAPADLFEPAERTRMRELTSAIDRARKKYGFDVLAPGSAIRLKQREEKDE
ncbi:MAG: DNA polymerase IV [Gemmatimonadales bacterium]